MPSRVRLRSRHAPLPRQAGFELKKGSHPIVPIMLYDAALASEFAQKLLQRGIFVVGFSYPVRAGAAAWSGLRMLATCAAEVGAGMPVICDI